MKIEVTEKNCVQIAHVTADEILISGGQSAVDLMMTVAYETGVKNIAVSKTLIDEKFFRLGTGLAGEVLQKFVNYKFRIAVYGDYSVYTSKPLKDFIYESNNGRDVYFTESFEQAADKLAGV